MNDGSTITGDEAVAYLLRRIADDPRLAYFFDPLTQSMQLLTAAYANHKGLNVEEFRKAYFATLRYEAPRGRAA